MPATTPLWQQILQDSVTDFQSSAPTTGFGEPAFIRREREEEERRRREAEERQRNLLAQAEIVQKLQDPVTRSIGPLQDQLVGDLMQTMSTAPDLDEPDFVRREREEQERADAQRQARLQSLMRGIDEAQEQRTLDDFLSQRGATEELFDVQRQLDNRRIQAAAAGVDAQEEGAPGLLTTAFRGLDAARAGVFQGVVSGLAFFDIIDDEERDRLREGFDQRAEGDMRRAGFGDLSFLTVQEDDNWLQRFGKLAGAFIGDVVTDPLTYISFGAGAIGRKAAAQGLHSFLRSSKAGQQAIAQASDATKLELMRRLTPEVAASRIAEKTGMSAVEIMAHPNMTQLARSAGLVDDLALDGLAAGAVQSFQGGILGSARAGGRGLKTFLDETSGIGQEAARQVWRNAPADVKGGVRFRVPFLRDRGTEGLSVFGQRIPGSGRFTSQAQQGVDLGVGLPVHLRLTPGGGALSDHVPGLSSVLDLGERARVLARTSTPGHLVLTRLGGRHGGEYANYVRQLAHDAPEDVGQSFSRYRSIVDGVLESTREHGITNTKFEVPLSAINRTIHLNATPEQTAARSAAFNEAVDQRGRWRWVRDENDKPVAIERRTDAGSDDWTRAELTPDELAGYQAADGSFDLLDLVHDEALSVGLDIGWIENYVPRRFRDPQPAGRGAPGRVDHAKERSAYPIIRQDPETGELRIVDWYSPKEANIQAAAREGARLYEEDPFRYIADYVNDMSREISERRLLQHLERSGALVATARTGARDLDELVEQGARGGNQAGLRQLLRDFRDGDISPDEFRSRFAGMADRPANADVLPDDVLGHLAADPDRVVRALDPEVIPTNPAEAATYFEDLALNIGRRLDDAGDAATERARVPREKLEQWLRGETVEGIDRPPPHPGELVKLSETPHIRQDIAKFLEETGAFGSQDLSDALKRMYKAHAEPTEFQSFVRKVFDPWNRYFKATATAGRGPGFWIRNVQGGMFNAWLDGVSPRHYVRGSEFLLARQELKRQAAKELGVDLKKAMRTAKNPADRAAVEQRVLELLPDHLRKRGFKQANQLTEAWRAFLENDGGGGYFQVMVRDAEVDPLAGAPRMFDLSGQRRRSFIRPDVQPTDRGRLLAVAEATLDNPVMNALFDQVEASETFLRFGSFLAGVERYGLSDGGVTAGLFMKRNQFDYSDLSPFEVNTMKRFLPFYSWSRFNLPMQARALAAEPGKLSRMMHANDALRNQFGSETEEGDNQIMPRWVRETFGWKVDEDTLPDPIRRMVQQSTASNIAVNMSWWPSSQLQQTFQLSAIPVRYEEAMAAVTPGFSAPLEGLTGVRAFTRSEFPQQEAAPIWAQAFARTVPQVDEETGEVIGTQRVTNPRWTHVIRATVPQIGHVDRIIEPTVRMALDAAGVEGAIREEDRYIDRFGTSLASMGLGVPVSTLDERQLRAAGRRMSTDIDRAMQRHFGRHGAPVAREIINLVHEFGGDDDDVKAALQAAGLL